jgi:hypothetical protein
MGTNPGFKTVYDGGGKLAGTIIPAGYGLKFEHHQC